jgi:hypothetical protein
LDSANRPMAHLFSRRSVLLGLAAGIVGPHAIASGAATASAQDPAIEWYDATSSVIPAGEEVAGDRQWAIAWLAAARALRAGPADPAWQHAALAGAVHQSLTMLIPDSTTALNVTAGASLARIPDVAAKAEGLAVGRAAARVLVVERATDRIDPGGLRKPFHPKPAPGVWEAPANNSFMAGVSAARPFTLERLSQFRPGPPPALNSVQYRADLAEVRRVGGNGSAARTDEQTRIAEFWLGAPLAIYVQVLRAVLKESRKSLAEKARLVALFHVALTDAQLACYEAKYHYAYWRPINAIQHGAIDPDPSWQPVHNTPITPDYPGGHSCYAGCSEGILTALHGPRVDRSFTVVNNGVGRTYNDWRQLTVDNVNARVWSGVHFRNTNEVGRRLGRDVAAHVLRTADRLLS